MDLNTIISLIISIITGAISLALSLIAPKDKRRKLFGFYIKDLIRFFAYASFILLIISIINDRMTEVNSKLTVLEKERIADSIQRSNFDTTLQAINRTLIAQNNTLILQNETMDSVKQILDRQKTELSHQVHILEKQGQMILGNSKIIFKQNETLNDIQDLIYNTDPILNATIHATWKKVWDYEFQNIFDISLRLKDSNLVRPFHNTDYVIRYPATLKFNGLYDVSFLFFQKGVDTSMIKELFLSEIKKINPQLFAITTSLSKRNLENMGRPLFIEGRRAPEGYEPTIFYDSLNRYIVGDTYFGTSILDLNKISFLKLKSMPFIILVKSKGPGVTIESLSINSIDKRKVLKMKLGTKIYDAILNESYSTHFYYYAFIGQIID